jgi:hypothetical protein
VSTCERHFEPEVRVRSKSIIGVPALGSKNIRFEILLHRGGIVCGFCLLVKATNFSRKSIV